jgi:hypothetical protein
MYYGAVSEIKKEIPAKWLMTAGSSHRCGGRGAGIGKVTRRDLAVKGDDERFAKGLVIGNTKSVVQTQYR